MTFDGYWELNHPSEDTGSSSASIGMAAAMSFERTAKKPFEPIPVRYGEREWQQAVRGEDTDVLLQVGDQAFTAHKIMLMARSLFFRKMFLLPMQEHEPQTVVQLQDMDPGVFKCLLKFMYTGTFPKEEQESLSKDYSKLAELLTKGEYMQLDGIGIWASEFLQRIRSNAGEIPDHVFSVFFGIALKTKCDELLGVLLKNVGMPYEHKLAHAVGDACLDGLISKDVWEKIKSKSGCPYDDEVIVIENCNPLIRSL